MGTTPDEVRSDVEARRAHLAHNVDLLADRVAPRRIAGRRMDATRNRLSDIKERVMGTANNTTSGAGATARAQAGQVRDPSGQPIERVGSTDGQTSAQVAQAGQQAPAQAGRGTQGNPLAAGIIAFGAGMLAGTLLPMSEAEQRAASQLREQADELVQPLKEAATETVQTAKQELREPAEEAVESVKSTAQEAVETTKNSGRRAVQETTDGLKQTGRDAVEEVRDQADG